jgi:hypothetical protein
VLAACRAGLRCVSAHLRAAPPTTIARSGAARAARRGWVGGYRHRDCLVAAIAAHPRCPSDSEGGGCSSRSDNRRVGCFSAPSLIGLRIGLRRECRHWWGDGMLLRVRVRVAVRAPACNGLRLWCFRLCFRLCFAHATIAPCASRCPKVHGTRLLLAPQASPHGAAGGPHKNPCYYALKPSRAPFSWARFSVSFSRSADPTFPIFTKPEIQRSENHKRGTFCRVCRLEAPANSRAPISSHMAPRR